MISETDGGDNLELRGGFGHAAAPDHGEEHEEIAQPQPPADLTLPLNDSRHKEFA